MSEADGVPQPAQTIVALADDPMLLEALSGAARAHAAVIISPTADRFIDQLVANAASIALIDASCAPDPLRAFIVLLREQFPELLLILAGPAQLQSQYAAQIAEGMIFRFLHKPASSARLQLFIDAALRRQQPELETPASGLRHTAAPPTRRLTLGLLSTSLLAAGVLAWSAWTGRHGAGP